MAGRLGKADFLCGPLRSLVAKSDYSQFGARWNVIDRADAAINHKWAAVTAATHDPNARKLAQDAVVRDYYGFLSTLQSFGLMLSKFDTVSIREHLRRRPGTAGLADMAFSSLNNLKAKLIRTNDFLNDATSTLRRLQLAGLAPNQLTDNYSYLAFATGNAERILEATKIENRGARLQALRDALLDDSKANNFTDFHLGGEPLDRAKINGYVRELLKPASEGGLTDQMLDDMGSLYGQMGQVRADYREWWIRNFNRMKGKAPTDKEIFSEIGGTFGAFMPRIWFDEWRTGFMDEFIGAAAHGGGFELTTEGVRTEGEVFPFSQLIRRIARADKDNPLVIRAPKFAGDPNAIVYHSADEAVRAMFPNLSEADKRAMPGILRHTLSAANDTIQLRAIPNEIRDAFFQNRAGQLGFQQSFANSVFAYLSSGIRAREVGPLMAPGGELHGFLKELATADPSAAHALTRHIDALLGRNGAIDKELVGQLHPLTRAAANSIFLYNFGPAILNLSSLVLQAVPFAMSDGFRAGAQDLAFAIRMLGGRDRKAFHAFYDESRFGGSFAYGFSTVGTHRFAQLRDRLTNAAQANDLRGAFNTIKEIGIGAGEWLAMTESMVIRPFSCALGLAKFYRKHPDALGIADLNSNPALRDRAYSFMMETMDQTTTLQGGINSVPAINWFKTNVPYTSLATMLTTTPANLFSQFLRDVRLVVDPGLPGGLMDEARMAATRRLVTQLTFGTALAGPYWIAPMLRELDTEDQSKLVNIFNEWERNYSLAGYLNSELAQRLNPYMGAAERFLPDDNPLLTIMLGPLARPGADIVNSVSGDEASQRRALGMLAGLADLPPDTVLPSSVQYLLPAGVAAEKLARLLGSFAPNAQGKIDVGMLSIPVPTLDGNRLDVNGRPFLSDQRPLARARAFYIGGRQLDEARIAAEGRVGEAKANEADRTEQRIKRLFLEGEPTAAMDLWIRNLDKGIEITMNELRREDVLRNLLPIGRLQLSQAKHATIERAALAAQRLEKGGLTPAEAKVEQHALLGAIIRFTTPD